MKRIKGGTKIVTGQITAGTYDNKIQLFDGLFTTGYRIVKFEISPKNGWLGTNLTSKVSTEPLSTIAEWDWTDIKEVAWRAWDIPTSSRFGEWDLIRSDNMAIMDLYISCYDRSGDSSTMNYYLELEKYEFTAWDGAGTLVRNQSQAGPA